MSPTERNQLNLTSSVKVTEEKGTFLGLDGIGALYVFSSFTAVNLLTGNFVIGSLLSALVYLVIRLYLTGKPKNFLLYALLHPLRPKVYRHQCAQISHPKKQSRGMDCRVERIERVNNLG